MNIELLEKYYRDGLLYKQTHPDLKELTIWNYSEKVQYEGLWDEITLRTRGLVVFDNREIIARPFKKFFNIEENKHIPTKKFEVFEKMDGSLIIAFQIYGSWVFCTRGSFTSDQAKAASKLFYSKYGSKFMNMDTTYLFEYTSPWNRIVVDYGQEEKLTLLGAIRTEDGFEAPWEHLELVSNENGFELVEKHNINSITLEGLKLFANKPNREGFVVKFSNGDRCKIKGEEYIKLHRIMTNISTISIWEYLKNGDDVLKILKDVPDEFYSKIKSYSLNLKYQYYSIWERVGKIYNDKMYGKYNDKEPITNRKEFAYWVLTQDPQYKSILFNMFDKKKYDDIIWKLIKPKFNKL